jgi:hypothetical protein
MIRGHFFLSYGRFRKFIIEENEQKAAGENDGSKKPIPFLTGMGLTVASSIAG